MARRPRPLDPTDGPLQAFAHGLRELRESVGNPTYRSLARVAGFSATTLSDAAAGLRRPSLEVTLAFVGACQGDEEDWRRRWHRLEAELTDLRRDPADAELAAAVRESTATMTATATATTPLGSLHSLPVPAETFTTVSLDLTQPVPKRPWRGPVALAAGVVTALAGSMLALHLSTENSDRLALLPPGCPKPVSSKGGFGGRTYTDTTRVRDAPSLGGQVLQELPAGCRLKFTAYCLGDVVIDATGNSPDLRWFKLGDGYISSAVVHGNPPRELPPAACPGGLPGPSDLALTARPFAADPTTVELSVSGHQLGIVGFAAYYQDRGADRPHWHQLAMTTAKQEFRTTWQPGSAADGQPDVPVVAAACLGGQAPTDVSDALLVGTGQTGRPDTLTGDALQAARAEACRYPING
ncbi:helix-turn-helix domain-containing protein [Kitasatospora sp. NPDC004615]|uniref:helix-turn-helix domain-containing protein n=1 Tax=Kitasatospora sp. NPDC004615 TaxID=3364017 RepID=UPI00367A89DF